MLLRSLFALTIGISLLVPPATLLEARAKPGSNHSDKGSDGSSAGSNGKGGSAKGKSDATKSKGGDTKGKGNVGDANGGSKSSNSGSNATNGASAGKRGSSPASQQAAGAAGADAARSSAASIGSANVRAVAKGRARHNVAQGTSLALPNRLAPGRGGATRAPAGVISAMQIQGTFSMHPSVPQFLLRACRQAIVGAARPYGAVRVSAASAGLPRVRQRGALAVPIDARIQYRRQGGIEIRRATISCVTSKVGVVLGLH